MVRRGVVVLVTLLAAALVLGAARTSCRPVPVAVVEPGAAPLGSGRYEGRVHVDALMTVFSVRDACTGPFVLEVDATTGSVTGAGGCTLEFEDFESGWRGVEDASVRVSGTLDAGPRLSGTGTLSVHNDGRFEWRTDDDREGWSRFEGGAMCSTSGSAYSYDASFEASVLRPLSPPSFYPAYAIARDENPDCAVWVEALGHLTGGYADIFEERGRARLRVQVDDGEVLTVGVWGQWRASESWTPFDATGEQLGDGTWEVDFLERMTHGGVPWGGPDADIPPLESLAIELAFFVDVRLPDGDVVRRWWSEDGRMFRWADTAALPCESELLTMQRVCWAVGDAPVFDARERCGRRSTNGG